MILSVNNYSHPSRKLRLGQEGTKSDHGIVAYLRVFSSGYPRGGAYHLAWGRDSEAKTGDLRPVLSCSESRLGDVDVVIDSEVIQRKTQGT